MESDTTAEDIMTLFSVKELNVGVSKPQLQKPRSLSKEEAAAANHYFNLLSETSYIPMRDQIAKWYLFCLNQASNFTQYYSWLNASEISYFLEKSIRST